MNGIVIINKEKGYTSHDIVKRVKKISHSQKVGHTGTLDPNATGVLPLLVGEATKLSQYLINHNKEYEAILQLGIQTETADQEGNILKTEPVSNNILNNDNVKKTLNCFLGKRQQVPPMYSAIKVKGKKLYQYARKGETVELIPREIEIYEIRLIQIDEIKKQIVFRVKCSKGTYIRTLCEEIAQKLGTIGYMAELQRLSVGDFTIEQSITVEQFENEIKQNQVKHLISIEQFFILRPEITLNSKKELTQFLNGVLILQQKTNGVYRIYYHNEFIGIGVILNQFLKREIVIKTNEQNI